MKLPVSEQLKKRIEEKYSGNMEQYPGKREEVEAFLADCQESHGLCLKFLYAFMHVNDIVSYSVEQIDSYVKATEEAWEKLPYMRNIPEEILFSYVLPARVNNEYLDGSRQMMFESVYPLVKDKNLHDAALTVNYWCYSHVTYTPADNRTLGPAAAMKSTLGRCGEESAFAVSALRSAGIPARQCYAPRWSHCDDNHAWVEVWVDGRWHYMGACEPEPVLDKGWFTAAASKAMLTHSRVWNDFLPEKEAAYRKPLFTLVNSLERYAHCVKLQVQVKRNGQPSAGIAVRFCVLNYSELYPIYECVTDKKGIVEMTAGYGDLYLQVWQDGRLLERKVDVRLEQNVVLELEKGQTPEERSGCEEYFDLIPPKERVGIRSGCLETDGCTAHGTAKADEAANANEATNVDEAAFLDIERDTKHGQNDEWLAAHGRRLAECENIRRTYMSTFWQQESEGAFGKYRSCARGNLVQLDAFLEDGRFTQEEKEALLSTLRKKDFVDCTCEMLTDALLAAKPYKDRFPEEIYRQYILAPRVTDEMLLPQRAYILDKFPHGFATGWEILDWLKENISVQPDHVIEDWYGSASGSLRYGYTSEKSFGVLFVTMCRTFGIPARRNPNTSEYEWGEMHGENVIFYGIDTGRTEICFNELAAPCLINLRLINHTGVALQPGSRFSLARFIGDRYVTMQFADVVLGKETKLQIPAGDYQLITTVRQIDGTASGWRRFFRVGKKNVAEGVAVEDVVVEVKLPQDKTAERIRNMEVLKELPEGPVKRLLADSWGRRRVVVFAEPGKEPTEHLLQELLECHEEYEAFGCQVIILTSTVAGLDNPTLRKVLSTLKTSEARCCVDEPALSCLHVAMEVGDERLPFALALDEDTRGLYASANYNIDTARTLLHVQRLWAEVEKKKILQ